MSDTREAAQRIVEWVKLTGEGPADAWPTTCDDAVEVARAYLALLDGSDDAVRLPAKPRPETITLIESAIQVGLSAKDILGALYAHLAFKSPAAKVKP